MNWLSVGFVMRAVIVRMFAVDWAKGADDLGALAMGIGHFFFMQIFRRRGGCPKMFKFRVRKCGILCK
jgi:hypothetical protein